MRSLALHIRPQPRPVSSFIEGARGQCHHGLSGIFLAGPKVEAVEFEKENANHKASALVAVDDGVVADDAGRVKGGQFDDVGSAGIRVVLTGAGKRGFQESPVAQTHRATLERQEPVVDCEGIALFDPEWFFLFHFDKAWSVLR